MKGGAPDDPVWVDLRKLVDSPPMQRMLKEMPQAERLRLAQDAGARPELLFVLAHDQAVPVRVAVAGNAQASRHAEQLLAGDPEAEVRQTLAARLARRVAGGLRALTGARPETAPAADAGAHDLALLEVLAQDMAVTVRAAIARALVDVAKTPPRLARVLAEDLVRDVAEPMLRDSQALDPARLAELAERRSEGWAGEALAGRSDLTAKAVQALIGKGDAQVAAALVANPAAPLSEGHLEALIPLARGQQALQEALVNRPNLAARIARKLADFVGLAPLKRLGRRKDFDSQMMQAISDVVGRRLAFHEARLGMDPAEAARRDHAAGLLTPEVLGDALSFDWGGYVSMGLALRAGAPLEAVEAIRRVKSARSVVAIAWAAGLPPRMGADLQQHWTRLPAGQILWPREGGGWPMSESELRWQLELFGL